MTKRYDEAVSELYQAAHDSFVVERKRLANELKAAGDKAGATQLAKLARPSVSAWAVNQLWWHARSDFEQLFETGRQLRAGKLEARGSHRQALAKLSARARKLLAEGGHAASEATVRRVEMTLAGLAASGGFAPDPEGALSKDRDPPGFDAFSAATLETGQDTREPKQAPAAAHRPDAGERRREHLAAEKARLEAIAVKKREAEAKAKREAEQRELRESLRDAKSELKKREHEHERLTKELATAARELEQARARIATLEARLTEAE